VFVRKRANQHFALRVSHIFQINRNEFLLHG
jgi:hypothetical protein